MFTPTQANRPPIQASEGSNNSQSLSSNKVESNIIHWHESDDDEDHSEDQDDLYDAISEEDDVPQDVLKGGRGSTNLTAAYVLGWKARHGWREYYQNWWAFLSLLMCYLI